MVNAQEYKFEREKRRESNKVDLVLSVDPYEMVLHRFGAKNRLGPVIDTVFMPGNWSYTESAQSLIGRHVVVRSRNDDVIHFEVSAR